jgi:hypothetical protein
MCRCPEFGDGREHVNHSSTAPQYVPGMDETRILALRALRELLDNDGPTIGTNSSLVIGRCERRSPKTSQ